jgi:hypothetical protein
MAQVIIRYLLSLPFASHVPFAGKVPVTAGEDSATVSVGLCNDYGKHKSLGGLFSLYPSAYWALTHTHTYTLLRRVTIQHVQRVNSMWMASWGGQRCVFAFWQVDSCAVMHLQTSAHSPECFGIHEFLGPMVVIRPRLNCSLAL